MTTANEKIGDAAEDGQDQSFKSALERLVAMTEKFIDRSQDDLWAFKAELKKLKDEVGIEPCAVSSFLEEDDDDRHLCQVDPEWLEAMEKIDYVTESVIAPCLERIYRKYFGAAPSDLVTSAKWIQVRKPKDKSKQRTFELFGEYDNHVFINTIGCADQEFIEMFVEGMDEVPDYFPEFEDKTFVYIFSTLKPLPKDMVDYLTEHGVYALQLRDNFLDLVNFDAVNSRR